MERGIEDRDLRDGYADQARYRIDDRKRLRVVHGRHLGHSGDGIVNPGRETLTAHKLRSAMHDAMSDHVDRPVTTDQGMHAGLE